MDFPSTVCTLMERNTENFPVPGPSRSESSSVVMPIVFSVDPLEVTGLTEAAAAPECRKESARCALSATEAACSAVRAVVRLAVCPLASPSSSPSTTTGTRTPKRPVSSDGIRVIGVGL